MGAKRVLLVDDELNPGQDKPDQNYMWYYSTAIKTSGFDVNEASGPDQAIEILESSKPFDVIVLDIMMPPGRVFANANTGQGLRTGVLLAEKLEKMWPKTPVLVLSNSKNQTIIRQLNQRSNVKRILAKPDFPPYEFVAEIERIVGD